MFSDHFLENILYKFLAGSQSCQSGSASGGCLRKVFVLRCKIENLKHLNIF